MVFNLLSMSTAALLALCSGLVIAGMSQQARQGPVRMIFDTDVGNDIDDALALAVIHALESRGECKLLGVTITKDNTWAAPFVDVLNTFYGRGSIPVGVVRNGKTAEDGKFIRPTVEKKRADGSPLFPHDLLSGNDAPEAVGLLRRILASEMDHTVTFVQVGFSTNLARLLDSRPDDISPLSGHELVAQKTQLLSIMAGEFPPGTKGEYNVVTDRDSAAKVFEEWPSPVVTSGFEIGMALRYPASSIERDFKYVPFHPISIAYHFYDRMPYDRPSWDLTSVLHAIRPHHGYFGLSKPGDIRVDSKGLTHFRESPNGRHRYLTLGADQKLRVLEALVQLTSQPPCVPKDLSGRP